MAENVCHARDPMSILKNPKAISREIRYKVGI